MCNLSCDEANDYESRDNQDHRPNKYLSARHRRLSGLGMVRGWFEGETCEVGWVISCGCVWQNDTRLQFAVGGVARWYLEVGKGRTFPLPSF